MLTPLEMEQVMRQLERALRGHRFAPLPYRGIERIMVAQPLHLPDAPSDAEQGAIVPGSPQDQIDHGRKVAQGYWPVRS